MLWDLIRDFFVLNVFGGYDSSGIGHFCTIGYDMLQSSSLDTVYAIAPLEFITDDGLTFHISYGDYLSTTATIISISIIVVLCCLFVYKIIKLIGGLIR